ncbi:hypothetical protein [Derxia gummosa]|uniref:Uncharacterized protein n=1 Tax=Derxia gummosa DSM 723 TaxID=1121388 RepID=A0A8B6X3E9_9BURK|nr:hypothetical protein [Derxia gummosa]
MSNTSDIQVNNYCAHALESLREQRAAAAEKAPHSVQVLDGVITLIEHALKFLLPERGTLLDANAEAALTRADLRLPWPILALEARWPALPAGTDDATGGAQRDASAKRIALCWDADAVNGLVPGDDGLRAEFPAGGVFIVPVYWLPDLGHWQVGLGGLFVPYLPEGETPVASGALIQRFGAEAFFLFPEAFQARLKQYGSAAPVFREIEFGAYDELSMLVQTCAVLNAHPGACVEVEPPEALNRKRSAQGKQPFFSYRVPVVPSPAGA